MKSKLIFEITFTFVPTTIFNSSFCKNDKGQAKANWKEVTPYLKSFHVKIEIPKILLNATLHYFSPNLSRIFKLKINQFNVGDQTYCSDIYSKNIWHKGFSGICSFKWTSQTRVYQRRWWSNQAPKIINMQSWVCPSSQCPLSSVGWPGPQ